MSIQNKGKDKKENMREDRRAIDRFFFGIEQTFLKECCMEWKISVY